MRPGRKRKKKVTLARVHERLATDLPAHGEVGQVEVDDPYEEGGRIVVFKSVRDDPLTRLHVRKQIDDAQFAAGQAWQRDYEAAEIGAIASVDTTKEAVDGRAFPDPITDYQRLAIKRLSNDARALGLEGEALVRDVLGKRFFMEQVVATRGMDGGSAGQRARDYYARRFRECLDTIAVVRGFVMTRSVRRDTAR